MILENDIRELLLIYFWQTGKKFCPHNTRILLKQNSFSVRKTVQGGIILHKVFFSTNKSLDFIINNRKMFGHNIRSSQLHGHIFAHGKIKAAISSARNVCAPSPLSQADFPLGTKGNAPAAKLGIEGNLLAMKWKHRAAMKSYFSPAFNVSCLHCLPGSYVSWLGFGRAEPSLQMLHGCHQYLLQEPTDWCDLYQAPASPGGETCLLHHAGSSAGML